MILEGLINKVNPKTNIDLFENLKWTHLPDKIGSTGLKDKRWWKGKMMRKGEQCGELEGMGYSR